MQSNTGRLRPFSLAMFWGAGVVLIAVASVLLLAWVGLGFTAGEVRVNPNARPSDKAHLERDANIAFTFFAASEIVLAYVAVKSGLLQTRLHWLARAGGALVVGIGLSCLIVLATVWCGGLPPRMAELERTLISWIQNLGYLQYNQRR